MVEHRGDRRDADARADQDQRVGAVVEGEVAERRGEQQFVPGADLAVQVRRHRPVGGVPGAADPADGDLRRDAVRRAGQGVLAGLARPAGQVDRHRHVLAGTVAGGLGAVGRAERERQDVLGLRAALQDAPGPVHGGRVAAGVPVEPRLLGDEEGREQPVDLRPGVAHLGGDGVAEDGADGVEQVPSHDRVLLGAHAERGVLVRDAGQQPLRGGPRVRPAQRPGEGGDRARQGAPLLAVGLVALVEQVPQFWTRGEHGRVEPARDLRAAGGDGGQCRSDDLGVVGGEHGRLPEGEGIGGDRAG